MKKRLKLNKVTLKNLTNEQMSTIAGGFVTPNGTVRFCCAPTEASCMDTCSGGVCSTVSPSCGNTCANTCTPCTMTTSAQNGC